MFSAHFIHCIWQIHTTNAWKFFVSFTLLVFELLVIFPIINGTVTINFWMHNVNSDAGMIKLDLTFDVLYTKPIYTILIYCDHIFCCCLGWGWTSRNSRNERRKGRRGTKRQKGEVIVSSYVSWAFYTRAYLGKRVVTWPVVLLALWCERSKDNPTMYYTGNLIKCNYLFHGQWTYGPT